MIIEHLPYLHDQEQTTHSKLDPEIAGKHADDSGGDPTDRHQEE